MRKLITPDMQVGWASIMCCMFVFFGIVLLVLGIIGEYIGKIILSINSTPQYIVRETVNLPEKKKKKHKKKKKRETAAFISDDTAL